MTKKTWIGLLAVVTVVAVGSWYLGSSATGAAAVNATEASYRTVAIERRNISSTVLATGVIRPRVGAEVRVGSRVSGILKQLHVSQSSIPPSFEPVGTRLQRSWRPRLRSGTSLRRSWTEPAKCTQRR
jgi:hypothetical protein